MTGATVGVNQSLLVTVSIWDDTLSTRRENRVEAGERHVASGQRSAEAGSLDPRVIIVGAGIGGLACAVDLACSGARVTILERASSGGGKASVVRLGDVDVDAGPTVLTMLWVFEELFEAAGASFRGEVALERSEVLARHAWSDGTRLDLHGERAASEDAIGRTFGPREATAFRLFSEEGRRVYEAAEPLFLRAQKPSIAGTAKQGLAAAAAFARLDGHRTMWRALSRRFESPKLRQLFGRYATYCGSSPFEAPATLNLIAHVESEGLYRAREGMRSVVAALERLARRCGVEILYDHPVDRVIVENRRVAGVVANGRMHHADAVVFNGDVSALASGLLGEASAKGVAATPEKGRSLSAVTWVMRGGSSGFPLVRHNVFFSDDYEAEFRALLGESRMPAVPTIYVCAQARGDESISSTDEPLLVLVNAPATGDDPRLWSETERERCTTTAMSRLGKMGLTFEPSEIQMSTPVDFHRRFPGTGGALYGPRSRGLLSSLSRESSSAKLEGLYLAGGSVHPGPGVPMAALSGRLAAARIREDRRSIGRSSLAATTGSISTD